MPPPQPRQGLMDRVGQMMQMKNLLGQQDVQQSRIGALQQQQATSRERQQGLAQQREIQARATERQDAVDRIIAEHGHDPSAALKELWEKYPKEAAAWKDKIDIWERQSTADQLASLQYSLEKYNIMGQIANGITGPKFWGPGINEAYRKGVINEQERDEYLAGGYDKELLESWMRRTQSATQRDLVAKNRLDRAALAAHRKAMRQEYVRRTASQWQPSRTSGASVKGAANRAIQEAHNIYQKAIRELDEFPPSKVPGGAREHREKVSYISEADWRAQRQQALDDRDAAISAAEASEQEELEFLGFEGEGPQEGDTFFNRETNQRIILRGGQWVPVQ